MSISLITQRVFYNTTDISTQVSDSRSSTYSLTYVNTGYIYVGTSTPFNHLWLEMSTVAVSTAGTPSISVRWGNAWVAAVDVIDLTAGMTVSNRLCWSLTRLTGWDIEDESTNVGITSSNVYDRYWARISWPNNFTATLSYIGQKFATDTILQAFYPDLLQSSILTGYKAGKTNWDDQHFMVAELIVKDLRRRNIVKDKGQVFDWSIFEEAACHKLAEIVYGAFGTAYREHAIEARKRYEAEINNKLLNIDSNKSGTVEIAERNDSQGWITR